MNPRTIVHPATIIDKLVTAGVTQDELEWAAAALIFCHGLSTQSLQDGQLRVLGEHQTVDTKLASMCRGDLEYLAKAKALGNLSQAVADSGGLSHVVRPGDGSDLTHHHFSMVIMCPKVKP